MRRQKQPNKKPSCCVQYASISSEQVLVKSKQNVHEITKSGKVLNHVAFVHSASFSFYVSLLMAQEAGPGPVFLCFFIGFVILISYGVVFCECLIFSSVHTPF